MNINNQATYFDIIEDGFIIRYDKDHDEISFIPDDDNFFITMTPKYLEFVHQTIEDYKFHKKRSSVDIFDIGKGKTV